MEPAVEKRFEPIEALLHAMTERENQSYSLFMQRMDRAAERADDKADKAASGDSEAGRGGYQDRDAPDCQS
jgi:hypothetical protein